MILDCIRHGETRSNREGRYNGTSEEGLTVDQARRLRAAGFDASGYDVVFCSPLNRCVETARHLGIEHWRSEPRIAERRFGIFEGLTEAECRARYPTEFAAFRAFDEHFVIPGGESRGQNHERLAQWIRSIERAHRTVLAITHGGTIDMFYRLGSEEPLYGFEGGIRPGRYASLSRFEIRWPSVSILELDVRL